jgi:chemosensory pili system protein ChpA (sensor histidine kinase/response regulator)
MSTTELSDAPAGAPVAAPTAPSAPRVDSGPLSWLMVEIRESLKRSRTALFEAGGRALEERATALRHARSHLHQAHGALLMVDLDGVGLLTGAAELALDRFQDGSLEYKVDHAQTLATLYQALIEYLEELLTGAPSQPVRLFPYYRAVQQMLGAPRIHPADLYFPQLPAAVRIAPLAAEDAAPADYPAWRQRFEKALLPFMRGGDAAAQREHAGAMHAAVALVAQAQREPRARAFWCAMQGFTELVADGQLGASLYVKQLLGMINLEMRHLAQDKASSPDAMLRDALFFIAGAGAPGADAQLVRAAWRLDGQAPPDFEARRYGQVDPEALERARAALAVAKAGWAELDAGRNAPDAGFAAALGQVAAETDKLKLPALGDLMRELDAVAAQVRDDVAGCGPELGLEVATALLFAEHGLQQIGRLPDDFDASAATVCARLNALAAGAAPPAQSQWQGELARRIEQEQTVATLAAEMKAGLRQVEKALDDFDADPAKRAGLGAIEALLHQLQGALSVLGQEHAMRAAQHVEAAVRKLAQGQGEGGGKADGEAQALDLIAQNVGALDFFIDMLGHNVDAARNRFRFDPAAGTFRAIPFEKLAAAEPVPVLDDELPAAAPQPAAPPAGAAEGEAGVEAELLEIFISEAQEVLAFVETTLALERAAGGSAENLAMLRRSFHTLKGSGRMVGLNEFADGAAAVERTMNVWLAEQRPVSDELFALLQRAWDEMRDWVAELAAGGASARSSAALIGAADRLRLGEPAEAEAGAPADVIVEAEVEAGAGAEADADTEEPVTVAANVVDFPRVAEPALDDTHKRVGDLEIALPLYNIYLAETDELLRVLTRDFGEWRHEPQRPASDEVLNASHTLAGTSGTVGFMALRMLARALEDALEAVSGLQPAQFDLLDSVAERIGQMLRAFALGELAPAQPDLIAALKQLREQAAAQLDDSLSTLDSIVDDAFPLDADADEASIEALAPEAAQESQEPEPVAPEAAEEVEATIVEAAPEAATLEAEATPEQAQDAGEAPVAAPEAHAEPEEIVVSPVLRDELDFDLLPVFLEEGADLLPQIGQALRAWRRDPSDASQSQTLLRALHTVKGSARMAGAMRLGQHAHEIETHIENMVHAGSATPQAFDQLLAHYDHALLLFDQLQQSEVEAEAPAEAPPAPEAQPASDSAPVVADADAQKTAPVAAPVAAPRAPLVRVRADILDRLVSQAGEVSIARSRLENEVGSLRSSLLDLSDNLTRLRRQLREVEMQAESQIASRMAIASEREFDPLEFDRFTRLQELTRMMAESVNDIASFHENLTNTTDSAADDLVLQARLTRDLQGDLMRVRMVPFSSIGERLFRVARQSAKELDKRVNLDIRGGAVEIDRSVLERMAGPFEHLLRNAIGHGIEPGPARVAAGKPETGELLVQVSQQGNEVVIELRDDGAGLDLARIRAKARSLGLLGVDEEIDDAQAANLIFASGFSTADALTELSGRGVGMDIVRSEAQALGGQVEIGSEPGKGACFTIRLPLTLALTQVVLVGCGAKSYALPAVLVEQVLQMKEIDLASAHAAGALETQGQAVALHYLPALLGEAEGAPVGLRSCPVLVLKNGADRLALQVDQVLGNREVVIKNIGPQLARMAGIAGATVLGSGEIVLILNPVALARHLEQHPELRHHYAAAAGQGAPAPVRRLIMVVDDSLTVRRVTQRLLEREGYRVLLAKDGVDALEQLQDVTPDLMLVDIEMPRMDGFDLTRNVRGDERTKAIPIIMITSRSADKHRNYALELGVNGFFGKPFQEPVLLAAIAGLL